MAHSKQALKRVRQSKKRHLRNRSQKRTIKTFRKRFLTAVEEGDKAAAETAFVAVQKLIDKAAKTRLIHPRKADRDKSRLQQRLNKLGS